MKYFYSIFFAAFGLGIAFSSIYVMIFENTLPLSFIGMLSAMFGFIISLKGLKNQKWSE